MHLYTFHCSSTHCNKKCVKLTPLIAADEFDEVVNETFISIDIPYKNRKETIFPKTHLFCFSLF